ncbi:MAG: hypothetical protein KDE48_22275 [Anaerolineales bacterium]|nr:hypothetical protein [Anaerolineales bacterium]
MVNLRDRIVASFNKGELRALCFDLDIEYENLHGETLLEKSTELIAYCLRHGNLDTLIEKICQLRPQEDCRQLRADQHEAQNELNELANQSDFFWSRAPSWQWDVFGREKNINDLYRLIHQTQQGSGARLCVRGAPGIGKSTLLARFLFHDRLPDIFDGVLWTTLGQTPNIVSLQREWLHALNEPGLYLRSPTEIKGQLQRIIHNKKILLVIDDVWQVSHLKPFMIGGTTSTLLFSTRGRDVAAKLSIPEPNLYHLPELDLKSSILLLQYLAPNAYKYNSSRFEELALQLEGHPLALKVAGRMLEKRSWIRHDLSETINQLLDPISIMEREVPEDYRDLSEGQSHKVLSVFEKSIQDMNKDTQVRFAMLGYLKQKPATFDIEALDALWDGRDIEDTLLELIERGLIESAGNRFRIHALTKSFAQKLQEEI